MPKAGFIVTRVSFLVLAASMIGAAMLAAPAAGQTSTCSGKCFAVAVSPPSSTGGQASFSFTITNEDSMQALGSVKITALAGFMITGASCTPLPGCVTSSSALFINLNLKPGATTSTPLTVKVTPSSSGAGTYQWGVEAKQSNDFNGTGNNFQLDQASTGLTGSISQCTSSTCSASASSATTSATLTTTSAAAGDSIAASAGAATYTCAGVSPPFSDAFSFAVYSAAGAPLSIPVTVPQEFPKSFVQSTGHTGASGWQICYGSTTPFEANAVPGTYTSGVTINGIPGNNTGLLLDCSSTQGKAPCVQARTKDNAGDVVVTYFAITDLGDGTGRGAW